MNNDEFIEIYNRARDTVEELLGITPENYKLLFFIDPTLYDSVLLQTKTAGSPKGIISSNELAILQELKEKKYVGSGEDLVFGSRSPKIFLPKRNLANDKDGKIMEAKLVHSFTKVILAENTKSRFPDTLEKLYRYDAIISDLFTNNVFEFIKERNAPWVWQYFQDFSATTRLLGLYGLDDFYVPPNTIRNASIFYNYLLEIKQISKDRSKTVTKAPLMDLVTNGIAELVVEEHLKKYETKVQDKIISGLKGNIGLPLGVIGKRFIQGHDETFEDQFNNVLNMKNDQELVKIWSRGDTKKELEIVREQLNQRAILWHKGKNSFWSDLWPLRASAFDKIAKNYVGKIQRRKYQLYSDLLNDSPLVTSHGRVKLKDREVAVLGIQEDAVGQEQLLILRNHLEARKDTFSTPLPGLPDVIVFKKFAGMHVASYLGVADRYTEKRYPSSPYDLPLIVRAVQVTRKKDAYLSDERSDIGKVDSAGYENLKSLTEPQHRAIRYLIRQGEVQQ